MRMFAIQESADKKTVTMYLEANCSVNNLKTARDQSRQQANYSE